MPFGYSLYTGVPPPPPPPRTKDYQCFDGNINLLVTLQISENCQTWPCIAARSHTRHG